MISVYRDPALPGPDNMGRDEHLLHSELAPHAALRIYFWSPPTISLGYFQRFAELQKLPQDVRGLAVVRRLTGGGAILHDREITYSLALPADLPAVRGEPALLYRLAHESWRAALGSTAAGGPATLPEIELAPDSFPLPTPRTGPFFCFEKPGRTDLIVGERKLLGSAQRRIPGRVLQHGSLLLGQRFGSHPGYDLGDPPAELVEAWIAAFVCEAAARLELAAEPAQWSDEQHCDIESRTAKYASDEWTQRQ